MNINGQFYLSFGPNKSYSIKISTKIISRRIQNEIMKKLQINNLKLKTLGTNTAILLLEQYKRNTINKESKHTRLSLLQIMNKIFTRMKTEIKFDEKVTIRLEGKGETVRINKK